METCPFCKADLYRHCTAKACTWYACRANDVSSGCGTIIDPRHKVAVRNGNVVAWPDEGLGQE